MTGWLIKKSKGRYRCPFEVIEVQHDAGGLLGYLGPGTADKQQRVGSELGDHITPADVGGIIHLTGVVDAVRRDIGLAQHELRCRGVAGGRAGRSLGGIDEARTDQHRCHDNGSDVSVPRTTTIRDLYELTYLDTKNASTVATCSPPCRAPPPVDLFD